MYLSVTESNCYYGKQRKKEPQYVTLRLPKPQVNMLNPLLTLNALL